MPKRSAKCVNSSLLLILLDSAIRVSPLPSCPRGQQPVPVASRPAGAPRLSSLRRFWPATTIYLTALAGPAVVVAVHATLIRAVATRDARWDDRAAAQRSAVQLRYGPHPAPDARGDAGELVGDERRLPDSHTTPSPSPSRMNGYAGWSRVTGAIPCARDRRYVADGAGSTRRRDRHGAVVYCERAAKLEVCLVQWRYGRVFVGCRTPRLVSDGSVTRTQRS